MHFLASEEPVKKHNIYIFLYKIMFFMLFLKFFLKISFYSYQKSVKKNIKKYSTCQSVDFCKILVFYIIC